ncbi:heavy metal transporter [Nonlabens arenilitoris]|uniref:Heavy metal transporter n=1 Tax=Nonlabens arenilitoris TaxID=1217969 RepID=A0A2S7U855_9FLAO|nr:cation transporter [Nonlabens arenilitoris]PQJ30770.1 heavy metal transporter [Nonlabens arenilitoris]
MKQITIILSIVIGLMGVSQLDAQSSKDRDQFEVQVDGLGCPFCAYGLEKKFKEFKGIKDIAIDIETGDFSFTYPAAKELTMEAVVAQVVKAGYTPNDAKITRANGTVETNKAAEKEVISEVTTSKLYVNGMCGMCKARIEKATTAVSGVASAVWDIDTKMLTVSYDHQLTSEKDIEKAAAGVGHDTNSTRATDDSYDNLHPCCKYERAN